MPRLHSAFLLTVALLLLAPSAGKCADPAWAASDAPPVLRRGAPIEPEFLPVDSPRLGLQADGAQWSDEFGTYGLDGSVTALAEWEGQLVAGGYFMYGGDTLLFFIGMWDGESWAEMPGLSDGLIEEVYSTADHVVAFARSDGKLLAAATYLRFPPGGGQSMSVSRVSAWDGEQWTQLGEDLPGRIEEMEVFGDEVFVLGSFPADDPDVSDGDNALLRWTGAEWVVIDGVTVAGYRSIDATDSRLLLSGPIDPGNGSALDGVSAWDGNSWQQIVPPAERAISLLTVYRDELIAWTHYSYGDPPSLLRWDGLAWQQIDGAPSGEAFGSDVRVLSIIAMEVVNGELVVTGSFIEAGGEQAWGIASWDGAEWHTYGTGLTDFGCAILPYGDGMAVGGSFTFAGEARVDGVGLWSGSAWEPLRREEGVSSVVEEMLPTDDGLLVGGWFQTAGGNAASGLAKWTAQGWTSVGSNWQGGTVLDLLFHEGNLYAAGSLYLNEADSVIQTAVAWLDGDQWRAVGAEWDNAAYRLGSWGGDLYIAGTFKIVDSVSSTGFVRWDGESFTPILTNAGASIRAITVFNDELVIGGNINSVDGHAINMTATWDGVSWDTMAGGVGGSVEDLMVFNDELVVAGYFNVCGPLVPTKSIARWDGSTWGPFGDGLVSEDWKYVDDEWQSAPAVAVVHGLCEYQDELYATGFFVSSGDEPLDRIARWNGESWQPLGSGLAGPAGLALAVWDGALYVGGEFRTAGGQNSPNFARWVTGAGEHDIPSRGVRLDSIIPNPMNPETIISFSMSRTDRVTVDVFDVRGRKIARLLDEMRDAGPGSVVWQGLDQKGNQVASGVYLVRVRGAGSEDYDKVTLLK